MPKQQHLRKILVLGSGPIVIGQAAEFDYAGTQACLALKEEGCEVVLLNNNPATVMTDEQCADRVYFEPLTVEVLTKIIKKERPDGLLASVGGQTGLNLALAAYNEGIFEQYNVQLLGTSMQSIQQGEDRELFRALMHDINEPVPESEIVSTVDEAVQFANVVGFPIIVRPAYTLGGAGGGHAYSKEQLKEIVAGGLAASPITQCLIEQSIAGFKEIEYEVMRDDNDTCITICNMENIDPVGVHTGDSIVVAPSQTLSDHDYQMLRSASIKVIRALGIVGGCNIQFALDPSSNQYYLIEVNPRVSRSSALASKATGYPIARIAAKLGVGYHLHELKNPVTAHTYASFEPALDYVIVKFPRWPFDKFKDGNRELGTQMKATGEVMAIERNLQAGLQKAVRSLEIPVDGLKVASIEAIATDELIQRIEKADDQRFFTLLELLRRNVTIDTLHDQTGIDHFYLQHFKRLIELEQLAESLEFEGVDRDTLYELKKSGFTDDALAKAMNTTEQDITQLRERYDLYPSYQQVDTCAGEFMAETPYYYSTWGTKGDHHLTEKPSVLIVGSGPIRIGQGIEFDYCSVSAAHSLKRMGYETIMINNNPETVSTDYETADKLYFEPLTAEDVIHVAKRENVQGVLLQLGGQTGVKLTEALEKAGIPLYGATFDVIDQLEDRGRFYELMQTLDIPHIPGTTG
ncbi:carbamoyl-phosphate synthase (glutamine-hydrolyzing) large subunit [Geomicrobium sp. JCM 19038]|uniref:carbamoyl-phosphate synthase (glutamine-hydrolyzing) large subunit n=1 Tax=Geomicrobium sp. JCM 19038 TaxID=1460635 RepID=UPI000A9A3D1A|nr:carbamoyl-phosphate synthase (glutamine-hydrolyzing) large subunit [Geomicrobium sp. JCM 19038]